MHDVSCCLGARNTAQAQRTRATGQARNRNKDNALNDAYLPGAVHVSANSLLTSTSHRASTTRGI
jgi:hypothetical protein